MPTIVVERSFETPLTDEAFEAVGTRMAACLDIYRVRWIRSYFSTDRRRMICAYEAPDAASVRSVQHEADARFDSVWPCEVIGPAEDNGA